MSSLITRKCSSGRKLMKLVRLAVCIGVILGISTFALGQSEPNLETGFKPYGSYHGTDVDTVSIMNGNVTVHIPFPADYPQRGSLHDTMALLSHSKGWHLVSGSDTTNMFWA